LDQVGAAIAKLAGEIPGITSIEVTGVDEGVETAIGEGAHGSSEFGEGRGERGEGRGERGVT
jgi:hypothetical protein